VTRDDVAVVRFVERFASVMIDGGVPRMPARVFAALLTADSGRMTSPELAELLEVSPAAISGATQYLVHVRLIARERPRGSRRDVYAVADDLWYEAIVNREPLLTRWEDALADGVDALGEDTPAGARLKESVEFFAFLQQELPAMLARWRASR
jgi:DNA-binding transcriptional regulator GbsR (MarR family)